MVDIHWWCMNTRRRMIHKNRMVFRVEILSINQSTKRQTTMDNA